MMFAIPWSTTLRAASRMRSSFPSGRTIVFLSDFARSIIVLRNVAIQAPFLVVHSDRHHKTRLHALFGLWRERFIFSAIRRILNFV